MAQSKPANRVQPPKGYWGGAGAEAEARRLLRRGFSSRSSSNSAAAAAAAAAAAVAQHLYYKQYSIRAVLHASD